MWDRLKSTQKPKAPHPPSIVPTPRFCRRWAFRFWRTHAITPKRRARAPGRRHQRKSGAGTGSAIAAWAIVSSGDRDYEIVGVRKSRPLLADDRFSGCRHLPFDYRRRSATVVLRTSVAPLAVLGAVREAVSVIDADLPLVDVYTMEQQISRTLQRERLFAWLCGSFGVLALVLCVVGLYGLMSHTTARRTSEMGIRRALGATRQNVMLQVFGEAMILAGAGMALGVPLALYGAHLVESLELLPPGEWSYGSLVLALAVVMVSAALAVSAPARRAASIEPMEALRRG